MSLVRSLLSAALVACAALPASAGLQDRNPITATVTGATPTGYPRAMVESLNAIVRDAFPGSNVHFKANSPGGGLLAVAEGHADFTATATGTEIRLANEGKAPFPKPLRGRFTYVMMLYDAQYLHFIMTRSWAEAHGILSWEDIAAKKPRMRLAINRPDNPQTTIGGPYEVMKASGFTIEDIEAWGGSLVLGNSSIGLAALAEGRADVFMNARSLGDPLIQTIAGKRELLWIDADPVTMHKAAGTFDSRMDLVPRGTYPFLSKDYPTLRMWVSMLAGAHVAEEAVYKYVKALAEGEERVRRAGGSLKGFSAKDMSRNPAAVPYHPGALRYYREKGWVR